MRVESRFADFCRGRLVCTTSPLAATCRPPVRAEIGFVLPGLFGWPIHHNSFSIKHLPFLALCRKLALFRTSGPAGPASVGKIGFVLHLSPAGDLALPRPGQIGSFRTFDHAKLGSFCTFDPTRSGSFCTICPARPCTPGGKLGFFAWWGVVAPAARAQLWALGPNWVRFAR